MKCRIVLLVAAVLLLLAARHSAAAERIAFVKPLLDGADRELATSVPSILEQTGSLIGQLYPGRLEAAADGQRGAWVLESAASLAQGSLSLVATLKRAADGVAAPAIVWTGPPADDLPLYLARSIFVRWSLLAGIAPPAEAPPALVDEIAVTDLTSSTIPLYPWGLAVRSDGTLVAALGSACLELDRTFRVTAQPGRALAEQGNYTFAAAAALTPSGTLVLKPTMGRELYRFAPGSAEAQRVPLGFETTQCSIAAFADGSILAIDNASRRAWRLSGARRTELPLFASPSLYYVYASTVAADSAIWIWDQLLGGARVHAPDGSLADYVLPLVDPSTPLVPVSLAVGPDGSFIVLSNRQLLAFRRDGTLRWRLDRLAGAAVEELPQSGVVAVDWQRGLIYLADTLQRRILKLRDRSPAAEGDDASTFEERLAALWAVRSRDEGAFLAGRARLYDGAGSLAVAMAAWRQALDLVPDNAEATKRFAALELSQLKLGGDELAAKALAVLRTVGIENARPIYQQAIASYERALSRAPTDEAALRAKRELEQAFGDPRAARPSIQILEARLDELFPSLLQRYRDAPVGTVTVKNIGTAALEGLTASVTLGAFAVEPLCSKPVANLAPGATATMELAIALGQAALGNEEDLPLPARLEVEATVGGARETAAKTAATVLHRRTALTWEDTGKIAAFITPNEQVVDGFAARLSDIGAAAGRWQLSSTLLRAMRICEGIGAHGIAYVEDPEAPISRVLGSATAIDTVRFARDTLVRRAGDCDDTTVLVASALESAGIRTAVLTIPGHIFLAFDSGLPVENASLLASEALEVIARDGAAWIPVETTVLKDGFAAAWTAGSSLVRKHRGGLEFLSVRSLRDRWQPLPLPVSTFAVAEPAASSVAARFEAAMANVEQLAYAGRLAELEAQAKGLSGRAALKVRLKQGMLHALFGRATEAERIFADAIRQEPGLVSPYINLANLRVLGGDSGGAVAVLASGLAQHPSSPLLNLAMARCLAERGDAAAASVYLAKVKTVDPALAARWEALTGTSSAERASQQAPSAPAIWSVDE